MPLGGTPPLQSWGQTQKWPTSTQGGYITPASWGVPTSAERGTKAEGAHTWARWLLPPGGYQPLQGGGQNQKGPTSRQAGYISPAAWGVPTASKLETELEVAHRSARWLHNPCLLGGTNLSGEGDESGRGPHVGKVVIQTLPLGGSPPLQSWGQNQRWPTSQQGGYIITAAWEVTTASERGQNQR